jgi:hypothetical protein
MRYYILFFSLFNFVVFNLDFYFDKDKMTWGWLIMGVVLFLYYIYLSILYKRIKNKRKLLNEKKSPPKKKQYIICAAVLFLDQTEHHHQPKNIKKGIVIAGRRHHNIFATVAALKVNRLDLGFTVQGFITNDNYFVNRKKAAEIAYKAKQINKSLKYLFSEDLY